MGWGEMGRMGIVPEAGAWPPPPSPPGPWPSGTLIPVPCRNPGPGAPQPGSECRLGGVLLPGGPALPTPLLWLLLFPVLGLERGGLGLAVGLVPRAVGQRGAGEVGREVGFHMVQLFRLHPRGREHGAGRGQRGALAGQAGHQRPDPALQTPQPALQRGQLLPVEAGRGLCWRCGGQGGCGLPGQATCLTIMFP